MNGRSKINVADAHDPQMTLLVQAEKLELLYRQSYPAIFASLFTGMLMCIILWPVQERMILISWYCVLGSATLIRLILFARYRQISPTGTQVLKWEKPYFVTLTVSSLIWGIGAIIIMPGDSAMHQVTIYYFLVGMSGGAIAVYSAHRRMTIITVLSILLPTTLWFFLQGNIHSITMAIGAVIFLVTAIRGGEVLSRAMHQSFMLTHKLKEAKEVAEKMARMDELTGLNNRRAFYEHGNMFSSYCQRNEDSLSMILMDIDHFKQINDTYGHAAGDAMLTQVGQALHESIRSTDVCARIGGEEFGILLLASDREASLQIAEILREAVADIELPYQQQLLKVHASFGVASGSYNVDALFSCADEALYQAKENGRNQVIFRDCTNR